MNIFLRAHTAVRIHYFEYAVKVYWRVNLYKLRRDAQQPPTDEEIVLQPLQPSRKKNSRGSYS